MTTIADVSSIEETHRTERRTCPQCGYAVANPLTDRCPRCYSVVPRVEVNCGSCSHQGNCEFARLAAARSEKETSVHHTTITERGDRT